MSYYDVLKIAPNASEKDIKNAYRALAKKYHPDTYSGNKNVAEEKMKELNEAYDILSNRETRVKYDAQFNFNSTPVKESTIYKRPEHTSYESQYKSPDPRDADYRNYYNYSPYSEEETEFDFSKLKELFKEANFKIIFMCIGMIAIISFLVFLTDKIRIEATKVFDSTVNSIQVDETQEKIPENEYNSAVVFDKEKFEQELNNQLIELEKEYNEWYEREGKIYEEQIKQELDIMYEDLINQVNVN